jgi:plastocyanin
MHRKKEGINHEHQGKGTNYEDRSATAGTYYIYCTIHQGMNLTIIVQ